MRHIKHTKLSSKFASVTSTYANTSAIFAPPKALRLTQSHPSGIFTAENQGGFSVSLCFVYRRLTLKQPWLPFLCNIQRSGCGLQVPGERCTVIEIGPSGMIVLWKRERQCHMNRLCDMQRVDLIYEQLANAMQSSTYDATLQYVAWPGMLNVECPAHFSSPL